MNDRMPDSANCTLIAIIGSVVAGDFPYRCGLTFLRKLAYAAAPPDLEQYEDASGQRDCEDGSGQLAEVLAAKACLTYSFA
jgi:hypothetical protein